MASYATPGDMDKHFGNEEVLIAFDRDGSLTADTGVLSAAIVAASEEIDSFLAVRYDLPLATVPGVLTRVCCDLAMYLGSANHGSMTEAKRERYTDRPKWLKMLSKGEVSLGVKEAAESVQDEAALPPVTETRLFTRTKMRGLV